MIKSYGEFFKFLGLISLSILKSVWRSSLSVLYLIVYSFLLFALINYYGAGDINLEPFLSLIRFLSSNWGIFWVAFLISNLYDEVRYLK